MKATDPLVARFTSSITVDVRLARYDCLGSIAHAKMLGRCRIISRATSRRLVQGLMHILRQIDRKPLQPDPTAEDIHSQIHQMLKRLIGPVADTLHTARSRNDQVALDLRLYCREAVQQSLAMLAAWQRTLVEVAQAHRDVIIPGYTHLQRAQPVLLAHHLLAYVEMLQRDRERLTEALHRVNVLPLGAGALAGTSLPIDRRYVARLLRFPRVADNSLDAVSDRDFVVELLADLALLAVHLSRFAEDLVLWATEEFGILALDDAFATGSSLMPQKKNPDVLELVRGQAGVCVGGLVAVLMMLKGLPLAYNRDLQWDKLPLFQVMEQIQHALVVLERLTRHLHIRRDRVEALLESDTMCATDLAEHLIHHGIAARKAHALVGRVVLHAEQTNRRLRALSLAELRRISPAFDREALTLLSPRRSVALKTSVGGTSPQNVTRAIARWRKRLKMRS